MLRLFDTRLKILISGLEISIIFPVAGLRRLGEGNCFYECFVGRSQAGVPDVTGVQGFIQRVIYDLRHVNFIAAQEEDTHKKD